VPTKIEKDALSGRETTGHEWDGCRELNTPLPKWWLYVFLATVLWSVVWFVLYPAIPLGRDHTRGLLGYSQRGAVEKELAALKAERAPLLDRIAALSTAEIRRDPKLMAVAVTIGRVAFGDNCAPCHGAGGSGRKGYPVLAGDKWRWGGTLEDIERTVSYGVRSGHPETRVSEMPRFGADGMLTADQIAAVADYVMALSGHEAGAASLPGREIFTENCAACHGAEGEGGKDVGAPGLTDRIWLFASDRASVIRQVSEPRHGVMPAWVGRLDPATIKSLTLYVHSLGGGQ
jgi:cytochrome c oxidase cbb3-type subunit 3